MEELEQKHLHLLQVVESEKTAKWQYTQHCEELTEEIKKLRTEVSHCIFLQHVQSEFSLCCWLAKIHYYLANFSESSLSSNFKVVVPISLQDKLHTLSAVKIAVML